MITRVFFALATLKKRTAPLTLTFGFTSAPTFVFGNMAFRYPHGLNGAAAAAATRDPRLTHNVGPDSNPLAAGNPPHAGVFPGPTAAAAPVLAPIGSLPTRHSRFLHGSLERGGNFFASGRTWPRTENRARSRDRGRERARSPRTASPRRPVNVEEDTAKEDLEARVTALEGLAVTHATMLQTVHNDLQVLLSKLSTVENFVAQTQDKIGTMDAYAQAIDQRITKAGDVFKDIEASLDSRLRAFEALAQEARDQNRHVPQPGARPCAAPGRPENFRFSPTGSPDPFFPLPPRQAREPPIPGGYSPGLSTPQGFSPEPGAPPPGFEQHQHGHGPQHRGAPDFQTRTPHDMQPPGMPPVQSAFRNNNQPFAVPFVAGGNGFMGPNDPKDAFSEFRIHQKDVDLKNLSGRMADFRMWKQRLIDHCAGSTGRWRPIFKMVENCDGQITRAYLKTLHIGCGYSAWPLPEDLENFIVTYLSDDLYERREAWTSGEEGNGFELYRNLFNDFEGGSTLVRLGGRKLLNGYGRPPKGEDIQKHFEDWQILLNKYGADLLANPEECYY